MTDNENTTQPSSNRAERRAHGRSFVGDLLFRFFFFLGQLGGVIFFTFLVFALTGGVSYLIVQKYIQGREALAPNLTGMTVEEAAKSLLEKNLDLSIRIEGMDFNDLEPAGVILAQFPLPGNNVKGGTSLRVRVSKGTTLVACPDVRLRVSGEAGVLIRAAELEVGSAGAVFDAEVGKDMVVSQDPPPNSLVARQTKVNLLVSAGPPQNRFVMPNLTDLTANEASALLAALGMRISQTRESSAPGRDNGLIHRQDPPAGAPVTMEDEILVEVTRNDGI